MRRQLEVSNEVAQALTGAGDHILRALVRREAAEQDGRRAGPLTRALTALPERLGIHIVR